MKFAEPLWLLVGVIACAALLWRYRRFDRQQATLLTKFIAPRLAEQLTKSFSPRRRLIKRALFVGATVCLFIALARPQAGFRWEETQRKGLEILFAVDTSKSMLAQDVKPSRLARAKLAVEDLLGKLNGDGVGLVAFAGGSFLQCPITLDYDAFRDSLSALDTGVIPKGGTDVAAAIREAQAAFKTRASSDHILILLTDGEDLEGEAIAAAKSATSEGVKIFTVGVGSANGELVPVPSENGGTEFVKDESGQFVKSRLDENTLKQIAEVTGGMYQPLGQQSQGLTAIYEEGLKSFTRHDLSSRQHKVYLEQFHWPLLASLALLIAESLVGTRRRNNSSKFSPVTAARTLRPSHVAPLVVAVLAVAPAISHASPRSAEKAYQKGNFSQSAKDYAASAREQPAKAELQFNHGAAAYKTGEFETAEKSFQSALKTEQLPVQQSAYYNLGNTQYRSGQKAEKSNPQQTIKNWESAVQSYDAALQIKADDADAKYNRDLVKRKLEELKQQQEQQQQQNQQNQQQNQDQQQNQNQSDQNKSDENKQDSKQDQQAKADQNKSGQDKQDSKPDQNQQAEKGGDKDKSQDQKDQAGSGQDQQKQPGADKQGQQQASAGKAPKPQDQKPEQQANNGSPSEPKKPSKGTPEANAKPDPTQQDNEQVQAGERREPGQMTKEEAKNLLDSLKGEERKVNAGQMARGAAPKENNKPLRDW